MEKKLLNSPQRSEVNIMHSLFAEMVLEKALRDFQKERIQEDIDRALLERNKDEFLRLTNMLKELS